MSNYLDIKSLIDSDYYKENSRLKWHLKHSQYDELTNDLFQWLEEIELTADEKKIFDISTIFIFTELASYITHVYDYLLLSEKKIVPTYSDHSNIFIDKIWNKKVIDTSLLIELENNRFNFNRWKYLYSLFVKFFPKVLIKNLLVSSNDLSNEYLSGKKGLTLKLFSQYFFTLNTQSSSFSKNLSLKVTSKIFKEIELKYFLFNIDHKKSIELIVESYISRAYNNLNNSSNFLLGLSNNFNIITGTGYSYYNRLVTTILKNEGTTLIRFNHGGDRCFFNDRHFWLKGELFQADVYVTYGKKWKSWLESFEKVSKNELIIKSVGSSYHQKIYDKFFDRKKLKNKKILYIPNSFIGEIRVFPYSKLIDPILFDWQKYLIELLENNGFEVIYKKHPKGMFHEENFLSSLASYESKKPMFEALEEADMVLCDMAGSAFIESMCAGKKIVLVNTLLRPFDENNKKDLLDAVQIIDAFWENNILMVDENELVRAFNNFDIDKERMRKVVNDYFLKTEEDVD